MLVIGVEVGVGVLVGPGGVGVLVGLGVGVFVGLGVDVFVDAVPTHDSVELVALLGRITSTVPEQTIDTESPDFMRTVRGLWSVGAAIATPSPPTPAVDRMVASMIIMRRDIGFPSLVSLMFARD